jgi:hypothetical protein
VGYTNRDKQRAAGRKHSAAKRKRMVEFVWTLKARPCVDCGKSYPPYVMDFDHVPGRGAKLFNLSQVSKAGYSRERLTLEAAKCDVVCSNCHRERSWRRNLQYAEI